MKKHICIFLMFCMVWGMLPLGSMAEESGESLQSVVGVDSTTEVVYMATGTPPPSSGGSPGGGGGYTTSVPAPTPTPIPTSIPTMPPSTGGSGGGVIITPTIVPNPTSPPSSGGGGGGGTIGTPTLYVANTEARIGGEAKVAIEISADTQMAVGSFIIQYNNEHLTPVSYTIGDVISNASPLVNLNYTDPKTGKKAIKVSWMSLSSLNSGGNLIIIEFHVNDSAEDNITIPLTLSDVILADTNAEVIPYEVKNGGITAFDMLSGDVNNDGNINIIDALIVLRYDAGKAGLTDAQLSAADVNKDGAVDIYDAMLVQRYDLGLGGWLD